MLDFPDWSDLASYTSENARNIWAYELSRLQRFDHYYSGAVFYEFMEKEKPTDPDIPLFPAGINLVKVFSHALADAMFGEWVDTPVKFESTDPSGNDDTDVKAINVLHGIMRDSGCGASFWEAERDRQVYGGCALRVSVDMSSPLKIRWSRVRRDCFFPIWDPENPDDLLEAWAISTLSPEQVKLKFGQEAMTDITIYAERWRKDIRQTFLGAELLLSEDNPYKIVPFAYIPRVRTSYWWGDAMTEEVMASQDQLNMTIGDIGDVIRKNAHPIIWGKNIPSGFKSEVYRTHSDALWDIGRRVSDYDPEVGVLEIHGEVLEPAEKHAKFLLRMARDHAGTPAIAYGDDDGGGQRSGDTLEIRLRPLVSAILRSRSYFTIGLRRMAKITAEIYKQKRFPDEVIQRRVIDRIERLTPTYSEVLPRSRHAIVDEVVKLLSIDPPGISLETAEVILGRGTREVELIKKMLKDEELKGGNDKTDLSDRRTLPVPGRQGQTSGLEDNQGIQPDIEGGRE